MMKKTTITIIAAASLSGFLQADPIEKPTPDKSTDGVVPAEITQTVAEIAADNENFTVLAKALKASGLDVVLSEKGPFTVFAPTDAAFAEVPAEILALLMKPEGKEKLTSILSYHVVSGKALSTQISAGKARTANGSQVSISMEDDKIMVDEATVTGADILATNGVIHVIDKVLMPDE